MEFRNLREFNDPDLHLPVGDKVYTVKSPNADDGLRLYQIMMDPSSVLADDDQVAEIARILGAHWESDVKKVPVIGADGQPAVNDDGSPVERDVDRGKWEGGLWSEMVADGLSWADLMRVGNTGLIFFTYGEDMAKAYWEREDDSSVPSEPEGNEPPPVTGEPNRATRRAAKKAAPKKTAAKKATSAKGGTGSSTRARKRTAKTTPAAGTTTR